jgi:curved DNA-binding protein CbpA
VAEHDYYRLLEVPLTATPHDIRMAYELAKRTYGVESLATYSLFDAEDRQSVMARIDAAYRVLSEPGRRREYDAWLAQRSQPAAPAGGPPSPATQKAAAPSEVTIPDQLRGRDLKRIREQLGVSIQEIANITRINIKYLQYLEDDQHAKLPHGVFIRGYLLQYAQALKLDPDRILNGYLNGMTNTPPNS